jgi:hypothetical protein
MSIPFFNLDNVRMGRFVRLDPANGQVIAPLKKGMQSGQTLPLRKRKGVDKIKANALGSVTLESAADHAVFKIGSDVVWTIDPSHFSGLPKLTVQVSPVKDIFTLNLRHARFPGTEMPADFTARIYLASDVWTIDLSFTWGGFHWWMWSRMRCTSMPSVSFGTATSRWIWAMRISRLFALRWRVCNRMPCRARSCQRCAG